MGSTTYAATCRAAPSHALYFPVRRSTLYIRTALIMPGSRVRVPPLLWQDKRETRDSRAANVHVGRPSRCGRPGTPCAVRRARSTRGGLAVRLLLLRSVLVATDLGPSSRDALDTAHRLASLAGATLHVAHVAGSPTGASVAPPHGNPMDAVRDTLDAANGTRHSRPARAASRALSSSSIDVAARPGV